MIRVSQWVGLLYFYGGWGLCLRIICGFSVINTHLWKNISKSMHFHCFIVLYAFAVRFYQVVWRNVCIHVICALFIWKYHIYKILQNFRHKKDKLDNIFHKNNNLHVNFSPGYIKVRFESLLLCFFDVFYQTMGIVIRKTVLLIDLFLNWNLVLKCTGSQIIIPERH